MPTHIKQIETYLNQCKRVKWQADDLHNACRFADFSDERRDLLETLARRGVKLFPNHPCFHYFVGRAAVGLGPRYCNVKAARKAFELAIELDKRGDVSLDESYGRNASRMLSLLEHHEMFPFDSLEPFGGDPGFDEDEDDLVFDFDNAELLEQLLATMPPELKKMFEEQGLNPLDALRDLAGVGGKDVR